jgi:hypothetical protein
MKKALLALVAIAGAGYGVARWRSDAPVRKHDKGLVTDRLWIDHMPRGERDVIQVFVAQANDPGRDGPVGAFAANSRWKLDAELFRFEQHGNELRIVFPQTGTRERVRATATECNRNGMDYCLELEGASHGVKRYYSREGWEIGSVRDIDAVTRKLVE